MGTLSRLRDFTADRDAVPPVPISAEGIDDELDQILTESNAQDVRLDTSEATTHIPADATVAATDTHILVADGTDFDNVAVSGDATLANTGVLTIASDAVTGAKINFIDDSVATTDTHILVSDGSDFVNVAVSGDATLANTGALTIASDAVTGGKINLIDDTVATSDTHILVSDGSDFGNVAVSGDATLANTGALTIANDAVTTVKVLDSNVTLPKIVDATATNKVLGRVASGSGNWEEVTLETTLSSTDEAIPTSKAVRDDIVSLVNDVGGFHAIADDQSFPNTNPDPDDGAGTVVSIANAGGLVVNGSGVSTTGRTLGASTVTINGIPATYQSTTIADSLGMHVISTVTLNTYNYHKIIAKEGDTNIVATNIANVNTVAGISANVTTVAGISANTTTVAGISGNVTTVAGIASDVTAVAADASDIGVVAADGADIGAVAAKATEIGRLGTADAVADLALLGIPAVITDMDLLGATGVIDDMETVSNAIANVNLTGGSIANVNTVAASIADVNRYAAEYTISGTTPTSPTPAEGDLWYDSTSNVLKVHNGTSFVAVTSSTAGILEVKDDPTPQLGGDLDVNGKNLDFPTTANISDCIDDDTFGTASATKLATSESIKAYVDAVEASDITTGGVAFSNYNTISGNATTTTASTKNMWLMGQISVTGTAVWTIAGNGILTIPAW